MNQLRNQVQLIGNLGQDVEFRTLDNGNALARVSIATKEVYTNEKGDKVINTQWHNVVSWGKTAELMHTLLKKGQEVAITGKLATRSYEDKNKVKKSVTEVVANEFLLLR